MRKVGLLGGMSWESTAEYYRLINELVRDELGGAHSAELVLASVDFATFEPLLAARRWDQVAEFLIEAARTVERAGAEAVVICTNTGHIVADDVAQAVEIPVLHIVDVVAEAIRAAGLSNVGLLGTMFTMTEPFFVERLLEHGISTVVPRTSDRGAVNSIIFDELVVGQIRDISRRDLVGIIDRLAASGAQGVVLGCTELELLVSAADTTVPLFPTARLHAEAAVRFAIHGTLNQPGPRPAQTGHGSHSDIVITRRFERHRSEIYRAFVDPDQIARWFGPEGFSVHRDTVVIDARVGGHQRFVMVCDTDADMTSAVHATYTEVVENEVLAGDEIVAGIAGFEGIDRIHLRLEFHDVDGGTVLHLTQGPYGEQFRGLATEGWESSFTKLDRLLNR